MPRTDPAFAGNLPVELTEFVGRGRELGQVKQLLADYRLVTLAGVGGTGKTRLAVRAAASLWRAFPDGLWFVDLTSMRAQKSAGPVDPDPDALTYLVMTALGLREPRGGTPTQRLVAHLRERRTLLVLDNCEHLLPGCAVLTDALLRDCGLVRILATSREPLLVAGEGVLTVPSLPVPDQRVRLSATAADKYESVALFTARARAAVPEFLLAEWNVQAVGELCRRLDGLPLAIELAAARVRVLAPEQMLDRLNDRFALLTRGSRTGPERQRTLRACVDWSFDLCAEQERTQWARLSVFAGGFELDAAERVCAGGDLSRSDVLDLVTGLLDKSILVRQADGDGEQARYRMLETIRDYGQDRLAEAGEETLLRRRHRDWYRELAAQAHTDSAGDRQATILARLRREHANLRAVVEFCLTEPGGAEIVLDLASCLPWSYWRAPGLLDEGRHWLDLALAQATAPTATRAGALLAACQLAFWQGDAAAATRRLDQGEELARRIGAGAELAHACHLRGAGAMFAADLPVAVDSLNRARSILAEASGSAPDLRTHALCSLAIAAGLAGELELASAARDEVLTLTELGGGGVHRAHALSAAGLLAWLQGELGHAHAQEVESIRLRKDWESDDRYSTAQCLEMLAWITADQRRHRRAAILLGAAEALWTDIGTSITAFGHYLDHHNACERRIRTALGDTAFTDAFREGQVMTYQEAIAYTVDEPARPARRDTYAPLTHREREVADLLAEGMSNREIAAALVVSRRTAESHVENILSKLGLANRTQVAAWAAARQRATIDADGSAGPRTGRGTLRSPDGAA